ncbi:MAG: GAF domain-containing protein [Deltaproteobacteria bacterium]|nr:GAF domain-containing protein [Deltaproteobacteria bacterium]
MPGGSSSAGDAAAFLAKLIRLANSNIQFEAKVANFLGLLAWEMGVEKSLLFFLDREKRWLEPHDPHGETGAPTMPIPYGDTFLEKAVGSRQSLLADPYDLNNLPDPWRVYLENFLPSLAVIPVVDDKTCYGLLMTLNRTPLDFGGAAYGQIIEAVANQLSLAIKNNRLATDIRKRLSVLNVLSDLGRTLSTTIEVEKVMAMIPKIAAGVFLADGCALNVLDGTGSRLLFASIHGAVPPSYNFVRYQEGQSLPPAIASSLNRDELFMGRLRDDPKALDLTPKEKTHTIISEPLMFQGHHRGSISLFNKLGSYRGGPPVKPQPFDREDLELLKAMNSMISGVVENALTFKEVESLARSNENMVQNLSNLHDVSSAMMTTVRYDELIWIVNQALTARQGLGFDKVLILLVHDEGGEKVLVSSSYWTPKTLPHAELDLPLPLILQKASDSSAQEEAVLMLDNGQAMGLAIPIKPDSKRILTRVIVEKKPLLGFRALDTSDDLELMDFGLRAYAAVPMLAKGREVGVIAVDRSVSGEPLTRESLRDLTMLANQAGLAIENTQIYDELRHANQNLSQVRLRLIEAEKLAAQGEMGTRLAHEIRNPLVSIGGFTQRLLKKIPPEDPLRRYPVVIMEEVERLNSVLNNVLNFSRDEKGLVRNFQLEDLAKECLFSLKHELKTSNVVVDPQFESHLPSVSADDRQVTHVLLNLIYNAIQAMAPKGGTLYLRVYLTKENESRYVACQVTDTGPGVSEAVFNRVFDPFFTTKTQGTGLGLSIVRKIVERYNGHITVVNRPPNYPDSGASFTFMFPAAAGSEGGVF